MYHMLWSYYESSTIHYSSSSAVWSPDDLEEEYKDDLDFLMAKLKTAVNAQTVS